MTVLSLLLSVLLLPAVGWAPPGEQPVSAAPASCEQTPVRDWLAVVGPMVGSRPAWLVDGSGRWTGATHPVKTLWVLAQPGQRVQITGRLLSGLEVAQFSRGSGPAAQALVVDDLARESARPGGATVDVLRAYAFIPSHVFYPSPGCWEFAVAIGGETHKIVRRVEVAP